MAMPRLWFTNRVVLGLAAFLILSAFWEFKWKPQYRPHYEAGVRLYRSGKYLEALQTLNRAYQIAPNAVDVIIMEGWANLKLNRLEEARFYFSRAIRIDPRVEEARMGLSFVALETGQGELDPAFFYGLSADRKNDPNVMILLAGAQERQGNYFQAAEIYQRLLSDKGYGAAARSAMENIFGLRGFQDSPPEAFPPHQRPAQLQTRYRASDGALWERKTAEKWSKFYVQGIDLGAAAPGYRPTSLPNDGAIYSDWLSDVSQLNANTLRVYTLLPPSFYRAFHHHVGEGGNLALIQQIWVADPQQQNLFVAGFEQETKADIRSVVDAIHGHGEVPPKRTRASGVYEHDLADHVSAFLLGREMDPQVISQTNLLNADKRTYEGKYLSIANASPTEVWLVEMADYLVDYETSTYNWQHPVAMVSGPATDPATGDLLEMKVRQQPTYVAGVFAAYPAFPFFPEYMVRNSQYANAQDKEGRNPVYGLVRDLRARLPVPLIVGEYGVSTSMEPRRRLASGWDQGGYDEERQAQALVRLTRCLRDAGAAGGLAFELADEWYRYGWTAEGFQPSVEKSAFWLNDLDPAKRYGLIGYRTSKWQLFTGDPAPWASEERLYGSAADPRIGDGYDQERTVRSVDIAADEGYLYVRLQVACLDCIRSAHTGRTHLDQVVYVLALNTLPGTAGIENLPFGNVRIPTGTNFLLILREPKYSQVLVAENYNPFQLVPLAEDPKRKPLLYKQNFSSGIRSSGEFQELILEQGHNISPMTYGPGDPAASDYDSRSEWYADIKHHAILLRIPWGKLLIADPSSMLAWAGYDRTPGVRGLPMGGLQVSVYVLRPQGSAGIRNMAVAAAMPASGQPRIFSWQKWTSVKVGPFRKKAFFALRQEYRRSVGDRALTQSARGISPANADRVR